MTLSKRALIFAAIALSGCSAVLGDPIVGRWTATEDGQTLEFEFARDGTLVTNVPMMSSGRWSALEGGRYALTFSVFGSEVAWRARIEGQSLMIDPQQGGGELAMQRVS